MNKIRTSNLRGQSLAFFAVLVLAFVAILAMVLDGGNAYANRRTAQNAADAGALAGARQLCITGDYSQASGAAQEYAIDRNYADTASVSFPGTGAVKVDTSRTFDTFFAGLFGKPELTAAATATAGCFAPSGAIGILPIAWACRPPIVGVSESENCQMIFGPDQIYIIMDNIKAGTNPTEDFYCMDPPNSGLPLGTLDCDIDNDGANDVIAGGDRSWLDLDGGGGGASELSNWINGGFSNEINYHTWFGGQTGVANSVFQAAGGRVGDTVIIPVFNTYCNGEPLSECPSLVHSEDTIVYSGGTSTLYFHVETFALFHITCVQAPGVPGPNCPGHQAAVQASVFANNTKTIEGYFVEGFDPGLIGKPSDGVNAGAWTIYLID